MSKVIRFAYVGAPKSKLVHRMIGPKVEGNQTFCGLRVRKGWKLGVQIDLVELDRTVCKKC